MERAQELARLARSKGQDEAGRLIASCVDRLLVHEHKPQRYGTVRHVQAGEIVLPDVDPTVTDAERVTLGLPPIAEIREEVARANRAAALQVAEEGLAEGANLGRVAHDRRVADIERALAGRVEAVWREGDDIVFCWRGTADAVTVWFGVEMAMERLEGTDLWVLAVRLRHVDHAAFSYGFRPTCAGSDGATVGRPRGTWRGPLAPPPPERSEPLRGELRSVDFDSDVLGECRKLHVYLPPRYDRHGRAPVLYATDRRTSADLIEPLIATGRIPPVISIGVPFGPDIDGDRRAQEYLPGLHPDRFEAHRSFFIEELASWAEDELGVSDERSGRAVFGVSNGAAFAAAMGVRHPEHFGTVIAFSLGITPAAPSWEPDEAPRHYLCAGTLEEGFFRGTQSWAERAAGAGADVAHRTWVSGHDMVMWEGELPAALEWAFARSSAAAE